MLRVYLVHMKEEGYSKSRRRKRCGLHIEANDIFHTIACMTVRLVLGGREHEGALSILFRGKAIIEMRWDMGWDGSAKERAYNPV